MSQGDVTNISVRAGSTSVLLVEDHAFQREYVAQQLRTDIGVEVACASNGIQALEMLSVKRYDLVICDLAMPDMDGIVFIKRLAELNEKPDLVVLSSQPVSLIQLVERLATSLGFRQLSALSKPLNTGELSAAMRRFDRIRRSPELNSPGGAATPMPADSVDVLEGLIGKQFTAWYQPQHDIETSRIVGVEVLARWNHPTKGVLLPSVFLSTIISSGWINHLNSILLEKALRAQAAWRKMGWPLTLSFNIPVSLLSEESLPERLLAIVEHCGGDPATLMLELTETTETDDFSDYLAGAARLKLKGFKLSIDDYGTGYSSLLNLMSVPFDEIKIDRVFVHGAHKSPVAQVALESSIALAKRLNIKVVAEGIEDLRDLELLKKLGCGTVQGYLFSKPMAESALAQRLLG
ncbi:EAL domain-containing protein (putative c-di-GMP-specific phosphodiesterase class I)/ActR/RegA family two-component response regulator [Pseudomonas sp. 3296]|uniref:EAL domain-containing response regulator n=1 Tax=Pseudomonas sp. 3296 TaxID=2817753 RepID=UPI00285711B8|nr:EAL domain-containing response regulator [Pseudomonas sp. 3296]MDR6917901.1 EAL domain-containing protein (putative c-di-GMP-specific phosphodiesterase class I)/ActR/RegA family two-component response regulator [Pseudomonas sp. 3296]